MITTDSINEYIKAHCGEVIDRGEAVVSCNNYALESYEVVDGYGLKPRKVPATTSHLLNVYTVESPMIYRTFIQLESMTAWGDEDGTQHRHQNQTLLMDSAGLEQLARILREAEKITDKLIKENNNKIKFKNIKSIGERIKFFRKSNGLTQGDLASALGADYNRHSVMRMESGKSKITTEELIMISDILDVGELKLLGRE